MRQILVLIFLLVTADAISQNSITDYGIIPRHQYDLKQVSFDKEAEAVILHDIAETNYDANYQLITTRRIRVKILKESALDRANIEIPYYSEDEFEWLKEIKGYTATINEAGLPIITELDKAGIFKQKRNERISIVKLAMPNVKVGSIFEYSYISTQKHYGGLSEWAFQSDIPTLFSYYNLVIRPNLEFAYRVIKSPQYNISVKTVADEGRVIFEMKDVAGLREEPYMDALEDYRNRIIFQLSEYLTSYGVKKKYATTWDELAKEMLSGSYFGRQIDKGINATDDLVKEAKAIANETDRMLFLYSYLRKNFNWDGRYRTIAFDGIKKVWEQKKGNSGELNLLLINLLKESKLETYPVLVSHRHIGLVNETYPFENQFNNVLAMVVANGKTYYLDATDPFTPPGYIPFNYINTKGFIVRKNATAPTLLQDPNRSIKNFIGVKSIISPNGKIAGELSCSSFDYSRIDRMEDLRDMKDDKFIYKHFTNDVNNIKIDSININKKSADSLPLLQQFRFETEGTVNGEYLLINLNQFFGFEKNPFVGENRFTNIHFGTLVNDQLTHIYELPDGFKPEELPKNMNLIMPDKSITFLRSMSYDATTNKLMLRLKLEINQPIFGPEKYPSVSQFFKKMVDMLNEPLVLRKK